MKLKRTLITIATSLAMLAGMVALPLSPVAFASNSSDEVCAGIASASGSPCNGSNTSLDNIIHTIINIFTVVIGITAVIMIMVGGFKYITGGGDSGKLNSAKNTIVYSIIGLVIVALAQTIVRFTLSKAK